MAININFFGGPSCGKSTIATQLFSKMKRKGFSVEYVPEHAKSLVYRKDWVLLSYQPHVLAEQSFPQFKLDDQVDYIVHDGPFLLSPIYLIEHKHLPRKEFNEFVLAMFNTYDNINIFLERNSKFEFEEYGRNYNFEESIQKEKEIKEFLIQNNIPFYALKNEKGVVKKILEIIENAKVK
jgi:nicotinamide riboside kinase